MRVSRTSSGRSRKSRFAFAAALAVLSAQPAAATPTQFLTVGDPIEDELRVLDLFPRGQLGDRLRLPHLGMRPLQLFELEGPGATPEGVRPEVARSLARIERVLGRDTTSTFAADPAHPATPRWLQRRPGEGQRFEVSMGLEGRASSARRDSGSAFASGSGVHARLAAGMDGWLAFSHLVLGRFTDAQRYADPVIGGTDVVILSEETYLSYTPASGRWALALGRGRWHFGPGEEGSLFLSRTSPPLTGLSFRGSLEALHLHGMVVNATLDQAAGEQLAAHRVEWEPFESLRIGVNEAARYHASGWQPLYLPGVLPYVIVQRLLAQDSPDSATAVRNNILTAFDASWRVAPGTRVYGQLAVDDLHSETSKNPDKLAWQLGWEGAGMISNQRLTWGGEITRVWRYVYTSYFGRAYEAQGLPIGFPTGPDSRHVRLRAAWDPSERWQVSLRASRTERGEKGLDESFVPGSPRPDPKHFEGVVERARDAELGLRWWPAGGVDVSVLAGWRKVQNAGHVMGVERDDWRAELALRLTR